jgi:hypothetical protein
MFRARQNASASSVLAKLGRWSFMTSSVRPVNAPPQSSSSGRSSRSFRFGV